MSQQRLGLIIGGAVTASVGVLLLIGGFVAFSILVASAEGSDSSGDGTFAVTAFVIGAAAAVIGLVLLIQALIRQHRG